MPCFDDRLEYDKSILSLSRFISLKLVNVLAGDQLFGLFGDGIFFVIPRDELFDICFKVGVIFNFDIRAVFIECNAIIVALAIDCPIQSL